MSTGPAAEERRPAWWVDDDWQEKVAAARRAHELSTRLRESYALRLLRRPLPAEGSRAA